VASPLHLRRLLVALILFFYLPVAYHYGVALLPRVTEDFPSYYHAARVTFVEGATPYGFQAFDAASAAMGRKVHPFLYPPPALVALWPFSKLSYGVAQGAFIIASHAALLGSIWLMLVKLTPLPTDVRLRHATIACVVIYLLTFHPSLATLGLGQVNHLAVLFLCLALVALRGGEPDWRIALPLSIAIVLKTYPVLLLGLLFFRGKIRAIVLTCLLFAAYAGISAAVLPADAWTTWFQEVLPAGGYANNAISAAGPWNQNINGFITRLFVENQFSEALFSHPSWAKPIATGLAGGVAIITVFLSFRLSRRRDYARFFDDETALFLLMIFLIAPLSWDHHLVYILPAAVLAISLLLRGEVPHPKAVAVIAALFLMAWHIPFDHPALMRGWGTLLISVKFYPVVVLWLFFVSRVSRREPALVPNDLPVPADLPAMR